MESRCVSINIGPPTNDSIVCELSDSDHTLHAEDLKPLAGFTFTATEVKTKILSNQEVKLEFPLQVVLKLSILTPIKYKFSEHSLNINACFFCRSSSI